MTPKQFKKIQANMGLSAGAMATVLGKKRVTIYAYRSGALKVSATVVKLLECLRRDHGRKT